MAIFSNAYSDELVTATELNRQPGKVLDKAYEHPITITRNDQSFALLRREDVAYLVLMLLFMNGMKVRSQSPVLI
ncbi:MAG: hypothetical protein LW708_15980 [Anabaena sp. 49628_E55]|nr:hypothetical protein [Anabaena sp. 49628_E55]